VLDAVASQMGFNPLGISCDPPFIGHLCLTLHFYRSSVLDAVCSQIGFNPLGISCDPPFIGHLCLTLHFYRSPVLDTVCSQMGINPPLISRDSPFTRAGRLCLTLLTVGRGSNRPKISCYHLFYRSSVLDAVGSQMADVMCSSLYRSSVLDARDSQM
jgi:hypothetical protein